MKVLLYYSELIRNNRVLPFFEIKNEMLIGS
jgi:hypothetical protein